MKSNTIRNDYAAARISAIFAIIAAEAIGVTLLLILIQSLLKAVTPLTSESILMLVLGSLSGPEPPHSAFSAWPLRWLPCMYRLVRQGNGISTSRKTSSSS